MTILVTTAAQYIVKNVELVSVANTGEWLFKSFVGSKLFKKYRFLMK